MRTTITPRSLHGALARFAGGLVDVAPGTAAWLQPNGSWSESNAGLIVGDGAAVLVDTAWDLALTRRILAAAAARTQAPITTLVLTHGDGDHVGGSQLLPDAEVICSAAAAGDLADERPGLLRLERTATAVLRRTTIGPPRRFAAYVHDMLAPFDFRGARIRPPDRTFEDGLDLDVGGREVRLRRLGPAHTAGDTIVHLPDTRTVFAGDLLFCDVTPNSWSGSVTSWRRALEEIARLDPVSVVPGHGPVGDAGRVAELDRYWEWLARHALRLLDAGVTVDETARRIVLGNAFRSEPWASWECPERTLCNVITIDRERRGVPTAITHAERPRLMWGLARLAEQIRARGASGSG